MYNSFNCCRQGQLYVICACGFDQVGKLSGFEESLTNWNQWESVQIKWSYRDVCHWAVDHWRGNLIVLYDSQMILEWFSNYSWAILSDSWMILKWFWVYSQVILEQLLAILIDSQVILEWFSSNSHCDSQQFHILSDSQNFLLILEQFS